MNSSRASIWVVTPLVSSDNILKSPSFSYICSWYILKCVYDLKSHKKLTLSRWVLPKHYPQKRCLLFIGCTWIFLVGSNLQKYILLLNSHSGWDFSKEATSFGTSNWCRQRCTSPHPSEVASHRCISHQCCLPLQPSGTEGQTFQLHLDQLGKYKNIKKKTIEKKKMD